VTSPYHGSTISHVDNKINDDADGKEIGKLNDMFILTNNNFARTSRYFVHFFTVVAPLRHETS